MNRIVLEVSGGTNPDGGSLTLTFPSDQTGRRRARRFAALLRRLGFASVGAYQTQS